MRLRRFFLLLLPALSINCSSFPVLDPDNARVCPYPWPEDIYPCICQTNEKFQVFLTCNMEKDVDKPHRNEEDQISKLHQAFQCNNEIFSFEINLNGHKWNIDISSENVGKFKMSYFSLINYSSIYGFVQPGAFSLSQESLVGVKIQSSRGGYHWSRNSINTGAFSDLHSLTSLTIDQGFKEIRSESFTNLPNLKELTLSGFSCSIPKRAFYNMENLKQIKLEGSRISSIETKAFEHLPSLEHLDLSYLGIRTLKNDFFYNLPKLTSLDLSGNKYLEYIGTALENASVNIYVNLTKTDITTISETSFKVFFENVLQNNGEARIDMEWVRCLCDIKWLLISKMDVSLILKNIKCPDGKYINEVDLDFLERLCPRNSCPEYNPDYSRKGN